MYTKPYTFTVSQLTAGLQIDHIRSMHIKFQVIINFKQSEPGKCCFVILRDKETHIICTNNTELFDVCRTRWVARIESLITFYELIKPMLSCFQELQLRVSRDVTSQKAGAFLDKSADFKFIVCLVITMRIMLVTFEVTNLLQEKEMDIIKGIHLIATLQEDVKTRRAEVDEYHNQYYNEALQLVKDVMEQNNILVIEEIPRVVATQYRANIPGSSTQEYHNTDARLFVYMYEFSFQ